MQHRLELKDGTKIILGAEKRKGGKRQVRFVGKPEGGPCKVTFKEGGARSFNSPVAAHRWIKEHDFQLVDSFQ